jgi:hypothetical protein
MSASAMVMDPPPSFASAERRQTALTILGWARRGPRCADRLRLPLQGGTDDAGCAADPYRQRGVETGAVWRDLKAAG